MATVTFRILKKLHIISNEERHCDMSLWGMIKHTFETIVKLLLFKYCYSSFILEPLNLKKLRATFWKWMGIKIGNNVLIGHTVSIDYGNTELITIEDNVIITNGCTLLCHRRDMSDYKIGDEAHLLPYIYKPIVLRKGCQLGMGTIIMPGVTIGEGAIVGARSVVTKDIPAWTIATGSPCRVIKHIETRTFDE